MRLDLGELRQGLAVRLAASSVTSAILLGRSRLIDDDSRLTPAFTDPSYLPFYYHLGRLVPATSLLEVGFRLGLPSACFLQGCATVARYFGYHDPQPDRFYSPRLARGNVRDHFRGRFADHVGLITDVPFLDNLRAGAWDVALIDEETGYDQHCAYLDLVWGSLEPGGILVVDYLNRHEASRRSFRDFCSTRNRDPILLPTRYGVGIIQR